MKYECVRYKRKSFQKVDSNILSKQHKYVGTIQYKRGSDTKGLCDYEMFELMK